MDNDLEQLEEKIKEKGQERAKKKQKVSGRSVFRLQEIIRNNAVSSEIERKKKSKKDGDGTSGKTLAGDN